MDVFAMVLIIAAIFGILIYYNQFFVKKISINPELNLSDLLSLFQEHFENYEVCRSKDFGSDFIMKKFGDEGIAFKLKNNGKKCFCSLEEDDHESDHFKSMHGGPKL